MGGSIETPFLLPEEDQTIRTDRQSRHYEITLDSIRQSPVEALNFPQFIDVENQPKRRPAVHRGPFAYISLKQRRRRTTVLAPGREVGGQCFTRIKESVPYSTPS